jgi:O-antigen/teichoic acid export membrane protein
VSFRIFLFKARNHLTNDELRKNTYVLILSQFINAGAAFVFWIVCAHLFRTSIIGKATAFVSFGTLVATFTNLGLPNTVLRFLPSSKNKSGLFIGALYLVLAASIVGSIVSLLIIKEFIPKLSFIRASPTLCITLALLVVGYALSSLLDGTLLSFRKVKYILGKALVINIPRLVLPILIVTAGLNGVVSAFALMLIVGVTYNVYIISHKILKIYPFHPNTEVLTHKGFALGNYLGGMFGTLPGSLLPIIVLTKLGPEGAAYFYMPIQMITLLNYIPSSTSQALMSESSVTDDINKHRAHFKKALKQLSKLILPSIIGIIAIGWPLLRLYGPLYAKNGYIPLLILSASGIFVAINFLGDTWLNIKKRPVAYFCMNALNALCVVSFAFALTGHGLIGVSLGWLIGQITSALVYLLIFARGNLFSLPSIFKPKAAV